MDNDDLPVVVCAADNRYVIPLAVMLRSLAVHLSAGGGVSVWVLDGGISPRNKHRVIKSLPPGRVNIHWAKVDETLLADMPVFGHVSRSTYYRFLLGTILPAELGKVIYLDVDVIVLGDIGELWKTPLEGCLVRAVPERDRKAKDMLDPVLLSKTGLDGEKAYFNAGVLLIDLKLWREGGLLSRAGQFVGRYGAHIRFWDQDILNCLLANEWKPVDNKWNRNVDHLCEAGEKEFAAYREAGGLIHFASAIKPWTWWADHPAKPLYFEWVDHTVWKGWRPRPPLRATVGNKHWYGKWIRTVPVIGAAWSQLARWRKT